MNQNDDELYQRGLRIGWFTHNIKGTSQHARHGIKGIQITVKVHAEFGFDVLHLNESNFTQCLVWQQQVYQQSLYNNSNSNTKYSSKGLT